MVLTPTSYDCIISIKPCTSRMYGGYGSVDSITFEMWVLLYYVKLPFRFHVEQFLHPQIFPENLVLCVILLCQMMFLILNVLIFFQM